MGTPVRKALLTPLMPRQPPTGRGVAFTRVSRSKRRKAKWRREALIATTRCTVFSSL